MNNFDNINALLIATSDTFNSKVITNDIKNINKCLTISNFNCNNDTFIKDTITNSFLTPLRNKVKTTLNLQLTQGLPYSVYFKTMLLTLTSLPDQAYQLFLQKISGFTMKRNAQLVSWIRNLNNSKLNIYANAIDAIHLYTKFINKLCDILIDVNKHTIDQYTFETCVIKFKWQNFLQFILSIPGLSNVLSSKYNKLPIEVKAAVIFSDEFGLAPSFDSPNYYAKTFPKSNQLSSGTTFEHIDRILDLKNNFANYTNMQSKTKVKTNYIFGQLSTRLTSEEFYEKFSQPIFEKTKLLYSFGYHMFNYPTYRVTYDPLELWLNYSL